MNGVSHRYQQIPWTSPAMRSVEADIECALKCDVSVLITGEPGVGKRSIAHRIHRESGRAAAPLAAPRMPEALTQPARLEEAFQRARPDGTVLLERVERISASVQSYLQKRIEDSAIFQRGRSVRVLTTGHSDFFDLVVLGLFNERLFYLLNPIHLSIPPLREHPEDIPVLLQHFLGLYGHAPVPSISAATRQQLVAYTWPGNVSEVRAVARKLARDVSRPWLQPEDLPLNIKR
jgi:DNA-binding NtrC family response regulator